MKKERAVCPYCGKFSTEMYNSEGLKKRDKIRCPSCNKTYSVVYGDGFVKSEKI